MAFMRKKKSYIHVPQASQKEAIDPNHKPYIPDGMWQKCPQCQQTILTQDMKPAYVCTNCDYHFRISPQERIRLILDQDSFVPLFEDGEALNPLDFPGYAEKRAKAQERTQTDEAITTGLGRIQGQKIAFACMNPFFMMGSMGARVGEKLTALFEHALKESLPVLVFTASGGARMQEGIISLMQMAKISLAVERHSEAGLFYLAVLTDPTTGGVTASFAMQADIICAEPGALIGFAGKRVIEQTIHAAVPESFQSAEHQLAHGFVDRIIPRQQLREELSGLLTIHCQA